MSFGRREFVNAFLGTTIPNPISIALFESFGHPADEHRAERDDRTGDNRSPRGGLRSQRSVIAAGSVQLSASGLSGHPRIGYDTARAHEALEIPSPGPRTGHESPLGIVASLEGARGTPLRGALDLGLPARSVGRLPNGRSRGWRHA
jgi:hypothetical protein